MDRPTPLLCGLSGVTLKSAFRMGSRKAYLDPSVCDIRHNSEEVSSTTYYDRKLKASNLTIR